MPQYLMLIYAPSEGAPPGVDLAAQMPRWETYTRELAQAGLLVGGNQLESVEAATTVRVSDGETLIIDGPFAATKEVLAGYYLIEAPDLDTVLAQAARMPHLDIGYGSVEVRPVVPGQG